MYPVGDAWQGFSEGGVGGVGRLGGGEGRDGGGRAVSFNLEGQRNVAQLPCFVMAVLCAVHPGNIKLPVLCIKLQDLPWITSDSPVPPRCCKPALTNPHARQLMLWKGQTWKWHQLTVHSLFNLHLINFRTIVAAFSSCLGREFSSILSESQKKCQKNIQIVIWNVFRQTWEGVTAAESTKLCSMLLLKPAEDKEELLALTANPDAAKESVWRLWRWISFESLISNYSFRQLNSNEKRSSMY